MKATGIRYKNKQGLSKPSERILEDLCEKILWAMERKGFITNAAVLNSTSIKIGLHMSSFRVNTTKLGHNARTNQFIKSPKGYKRTDVPTWDQRVEFNDIVNDLFDSYSLQATIKSGCYTVRSRQGRRSEHDWHHETPMSYHFNADADREILPEADMRERCDSDRLEREHREKTKVERLEKAREYRKRIKLFEQAKRVIVAVFYQYRDKPTKNGKQLTHAKFFMLLQNLASWEAKRIRKASIEATLKQVQS